MVDLYEQESDGCHLDSMEMSLVTKGQILVKFTTLTNVVTNVISSGYESWIWLLRYTSGVHVLCEEF